MSIRLPRAALIDLDGTIIDSIESAQESWEAVCSIAAPRLQVPAARLYQAIDIRRTAFWDDPVLGPRGRMDLRAATRQIVIRALLDLGFDRAEEAFPIADGFRDRRDRFKLLPGAIHTLKALCSADVRLALITNGVGPIQRSKVEEFRLGQYFEQILIEGELGFGKPDERIYRHALDSLDVSPADAWMVGDDLEWEVAAPQRLGIYSIWIKGSTMGMPTPRRDGIRPDRVIGSLAELLK